MQSKSMQELLNLDPVLAEQERAIREQYIDQLFKPIQEWQSHMAVRWLVEGLFPIGYLVLLAGSPKAGKTSFATAVALAVANGVPFAGRNTQQAAVLWIAGEENHVERQLLLGQSPLAETSTPLWTCYDRINIDDPASLDIVSEWVQRTGARLIVVDPLMGSIEGRSLGDGWSARRSLHPLKQFCASHNVTALVLHHPKRDNLRRRIAVADNAQLAATASMSIVLSSYPSPVPMDQLIPSHTSPSTGEGRVGVTQQYTSSSQLPNTNNQLQITHPRIVKLLSEGRGAWANQTLLFASAGPMHYHSLGKTPEIKNDEKLTKLEREILAALKDKESMTSAEILDVTKILPGTARNLMTNLRRKGWISVISGSKWPRRYALAREFNESPKK